MKYITFFLFVFISCIASKDNQYIEEKCLFEVNKEYKNVSIPPVYPTKYSRLFYKHGYSGNGYCWQDHIIQILERENPVLLNSIHFDSNSDEFFARMNDDKTIEQFLELLCPIFNDFKQLEKYIKGADRSRIDY